MEFKLDDGTRAIESSPGSNPLTTAGVRINLELADVFSSGCTIFFNTSLEAIDHAFGTETTILTNIQNSNAVLKEKE